MWRAKPWTKHSANQDYVVDVDGIIEETYGMVYGCIRKTGGSYSINPLSPNDVYRRHLDPMHL